MLSLQAIGMYNFAVYIEPDFAKKIDLPEQSKLLPQFHFMAAAAQGLYRKTVYSL
jgi:hypothetical protein